MQLDRRKELVLKALPQRKKTSKKLRQQLLQDIYYRVSSLPQKKSLQVRQTSNSNPKRYSELKDHSQEFHNNQKQKVLLQQKQSFLNNQKVSRKNLSLPKNFNPGGKMEHESTQALLPNAKKSDNQRTKVKKFSQKQERTALTESQQKYRLKTLQDILKKKDSKRLIRESFLHYNIKQSPVEAQRKNRNKDNKMMNMKHAFENRKFTNLSKYKMSTGSRNNDPFAENKNQERKQSNFMSRKVSKQNSKKRIRTQNNQKIEQQFFIIEDKKDQVRQIEIKVIKDLVLTDYMDTENTTLKNSQKQIITLEDCFQQALGILTNYKENRQLLISKDDKILKKAQKLLKSIQSQAGSLSRKTSLLLGKVNFYLGQYNNCIYYLENVFKESNYNLQCIDSLKYLKIEEDFWQFFSEFYFILGESYKKTQNFLCTIKVLDQWQANVVKKIIKNYKNKQSYNESQKQTISEVDFASKYRTQMKDNTIQQDDQHDSQKIFNDIHEKKRSHSILRDYGQKILISKIREKQRTQNLIKKDTIKSNNQRLSLKPRTRNLSIKTLSEINVNLTAKDENKAVSLMDLQKCPQKIYLKNGYLIRARIQFQIKNFYASIQDYERVLACQPTNIEAGLQLATLYYKIGRKDKAVSFLQDLLKLIHVESQQYWQVMYHLTVMLYKNKKYDESLKLISLMVKQGRNFDFMGQIYFYQALNLIKIKKIFKFQGIEAQKLKQKDKTKNIEDILVSLQKTIDFCSSDFYVYAAYFLKIYIFIFQIKHYYGAQYEIDRLKASIDRKKIIQKKNNSTKKGQKQRIDYRNVSVQFFAKIINLDDLIQITGGIICVLKLKLLKGLEMISQIQKKVKFNKSMLTCDVLGIENKQPINFLQSEQKYQINQILKLLYQFKYYGLYTMRSYRKGLTYLEKIKQIDTNSQKQNKIQLRINEEKKLIGYELFKDESDRVNYLTLQSLILIDQKKFQQALNVIKIIETQSNQSQGKRIKTHKKPKSGNMDTISTVMQIKKQGNTVQIIKSLCYILLYKYLQSQKYKQISRKNTIETKRQIKIQEGEQEKQQFHERNDEILLVAEDLLSQCLICDQENFQILFLIALIHYELKRYDSALNHIRQAIQLSDDHMIKHYYLKANMKLLLGKYEEAIKDYSNAITVFKQLQKQKGDIKSPSAKEQNLINKKANTFIEENLSFQSHSGRKNQNFPTQSNILTGRSLTSTKQDGNQYYEEQQQMHPQIYLNRAISYIKHAYSLQYETCHQTKGKTQQNKFSSYSDVRQNISNLKSAAGQDIKQYFNDLIVKLKVKSLQESQPNKKVKGYDSLHDTIEKSPKSPLKRNQKSPKRSVLNSSKAKNTQFMKYAEQLRLFLHTSDLQLMLEVSKSFEKQFGNKLMSDQELMNYFYLAKQLNNCLNLMDKIIKKHYLSERSQRQENIRHNQLKKYSSSKTVQPDEPYFKSKKQYKLSRNNNLSEFNVQKYNHKDTSNGKLIHQNDMQLQRTRREQSKIQKLIIDKKILSALKDSSNNQRQDYENALVTMLQEQENIVKEYSTNLQQNEFECGNIFKYADLVFFIGVMYYLLEDYNRSVKYFERSYQLKKQSNQLYSLKKTVTKSLISSEDEEESQKNTGLQQISIENLKAFEEIYDNRIYSKQEINYNIGVAHLMAGDYNSAYDYLEKYDYFVTIIQNSLTEVNSDSRDDEEPKKQANIKKVKNQDERSQKDKDEQQQQQIPDITPFPTHNRLCSIYPTKEINGFKFSISFCLPKMELPSLGFFHSDQIQAAEHFKTFQENNIQENQDVSSDEDKRKDATLNLLDQQSDVPIISQNTQQKFIIKKQNILNFLDIVSLKDIAMKPIAPWIKKDKQKKCIRFTDNFLSQSFDLMTQCATQRRPRNSSRKQMFGQSKHNQSQQMKQKDHNKNISNKGMSLQREDFERKGNKKITEQNPNFSKVKEKQKQANKRYETIQN